ncbi:MAG TPA: GNAT family N-acetyltransferase [Candidatus Dormibacteraeota bacterium]|nr:GNAT family N-acetyltransferase [Candidatus Dormibacteraeota bacterium]
MRAPPGLAVTGTIDDVPQQEWDRLATATFYQSHGWLRSVERNRTAEVRYLLVRAGGRLAGALPVYRVREEQNDWYRTERLAGGRWAGRYLLAGSRRGHANDLLLEPALDAAGRRAVLGALVCGLEDAVRDAGMDGALFPYLSTAAAEQLAPLASMPLLTGSAAVLPVPGRGFDDYLAGLSAQRAQKVRREIRVFERAGYTVTEESLPDCWREAGRLIGQLQRKYGHAGSDERWLAGIRRQAEELGHAGVVFGCRAGGALVGFTLGYEWAGQLAMRTAGFDYTSLADAYEYFVLCFYRPLQFAYRRGLHTIQLGQESYESKVRRGAALVPLWTVCVGPYGSVGPPPESWNAGAARRLRDRYGPAMSDPGWQRWGASGDV